MRKSFILIFCLLLNLANYVLAENNNVLHLSLPNLKWAIEIPVQGFEVKGQESLPDLKGLQILIENKSIGIVLSAFIAPAKNKITSSEYRDYAFASLSNAQYPISDIKKYETTPWAYTEYMIESYDKFKDFNQKNIFMYLAKEDMWVDLHISKTNFKKEDELIIKKIIDSIKLIESYIPSSYENFSFGSYFFTKKDYPQAIKFYSEALEQEKINPQISDIYWLVLVDNLGMAKGISGDIEGSKKIYEYAISKKPEYPMFYYNLACGYGEEGDLDNALKNLKLAYKYKENMISGEKIPNPETDSSFNKFLEEDSFKEFLLSIK